MKIQVERALERVEFDIGIDVDVQNYGEIVKSRKGGLAALFSGLGSVRRQIDEQIHDEVKRSIESGLDIQLRPETVGRLESGLRDSLQETLAPRLAENGVQADVKVEVDAS